MRMRCRLLNTGLVCAILTLCTAADWTQFRGPGGSATSADTGLPVEWSSDRNVVWRTKLPGLGSSCPITLNGRIYVTCYSGYGIEPNQGDMKDLLRHVVCLDEATGKILWKKDFQPVLPESRYGGGNSSWHGYATSTPTTDGERLYVFFGKSGVYCLDLDGNEIWHTSVGERTHSWGSGSSPVLYDDLVIVNASVESGSLVALDKQTGEVVWRVPRIRGCWNTPVLVPLPDGRTELVLSLPGRPEGRIVGFDPATGKELWHCAGIEDGGYVVPSVVAHDGIVYAIGGRRNTAVAVRAGGRGDVTDTHLLWRVHRGSNVSSPVYHDGHLYWVHERRGIAYCLDAKTGEVVYEQRLRPRPGIVYSSAIQADGRIYVVSQRNGAYVLAAEPRFRLLAHNRFDDDSSRTNASLVVSNGRLLLRSDRYLYCLGAR